MAESEERWTLKKEIQVGHLITTITVIIAALMYMTKIEQRVAIIESQVAGAKDNANVFRAQLDKINDKLDRLIERDHK